jgi:hypothetical protein
MNQRRIGLLTQLKGAMVEAQLARETQAKAVKTFTGRLKAIRTGGEALAPGKLFGRHDALIRVREWRNRFFPAKDVETLTQALHGYANLEMGIWASSFNKIGNTVRFFAAVGDFAAPFTHGLITLAADPVAWAKGTLLHYQAFFDPTVQARFMREHLGTYKEMAQHGVPVGDVEFFILLEKGQGPAIGALTRFLPKGDEVRSLLQHGGRQTFGRFQSSYHMGLGAWRVFLWETLKPTWKGTTPELAAYVRNMTGGLDSRAAGL